MAVEERAGINYKAAGNGKWFSPPRTASPEVVVAGDSTLHAYGGRKHFARMLGTEVRMLVAANYAPCHYCLAPVGFERGRFVYTDPHFDFVDEHRD